MTILTLTLVLAFFVLPIILTISEYIYRKKEKTNDIAPRYTRKRSLIGLIVCFLPTLLFLLYPGNLIIRELIVPLSFNIVLCMSPIIFYLQNLVSPPLQKSNRLKSFWIILLANLAILIIGLIATILFSK